MLRATDGKELRIASFGSALGNLELSEKKFRSDAGSVSVPHSTVTCLLGAVIIELSIGVNLNFCLQPTTLDVTPDIENILALHVLVII